VPVSSMFIQECSAKAAEGKSTLKSEVTRPSLSGTEGQYRR
jgi:hypothetical protein